MADVKAWHKRAVQEAAEKASAASVHVLGTIGALSVSKAAEHIQMCLDSAFSGEYDDQDWFIAGPLTVLVNRRGSPWPTFSVYVKADEGRYYPEDLP
jgi:hypothetical protein